jgi:hypothetical protein
MMLLAIELQKAGIEFVEGKARRRGGYWIDADVVVATEDDVAKAFAWANRVGVGSFSCRVATPAEKRRLEERS